MARSDEQLRVECMCGGEEIAVSWSADFDPETIDLSFWEVGHKRYSTHLPYLIRQIIQLCKEGHPFSDMVALNSKEARTLGEKLIELADQSDLVVAVNAKRAEAERGGREADGDRGDAEVHDAVPREHSET